MKIPNTCIRFAKELNIKLTKSNLKQSSTPYNFPLRKEAIAKLEFQSANEASEIIKFATQHKYEIITQSGNTNLVESATPCTHKSEKQTLIVGSKNKEWVIDRNAKQITVGAGITLQAVQNIANAENLRFPVNFGSKGTAQIGGAIATGAKGMGVGISHVLSQLTIVDGKGEIHTITYDQAPSISNSELPGKNDAWPLASQGYLGIITSVTLNLWHTYTQLETLFIGTSSIKILQDLLEQIDHHLKAQNFPAKIEYAEFIYAEAMHNVFEHLKNPFQNTRHNIYGLIQIGSTTKNQSKHLKEIILEALSKIDTKTEIILAKSETETNHLIQLRESVSDAARIKCKALKLCPIPFDISCSKNDVLELLGQLDSMTSQYKHHVFGHLRQGQGLFPIIHYNLGIPESEKRKIPKLETQIYTHLYKNFKAVSHSAEHGGLGSKNLITTTNFTDLEQLKTFNSKLLKFNPFSTLQTSRIELFNDLFNKRLNS